MDAAAKQHEREHLVAELFGGDPATEALAGRLLRTREVALLFQVSERAVTDWARKGPAAIGAYARGTPPVSRRPGARVVDPDGPGHP